MSNVITKQIQDKISHYFLKQDPGSSPHARLAINKKMKINCKIRNTRMYLQNYYTKRAVPFEDYSRID